MDRIREIKQSKMFKKGDIIIGVMVLIIIFVCIFFVFLPSGARVEIYSAGKLVHRLSLNYDAKYQISYNDQKNYVIIKGGEVYIEGSTCHDKICEKTHMTSAGQTLTCLPNKLIIKIIGKSQGVDGEV